MEVELGVAEELEYVGSTTTVLLELLELLELVADELDPLPPALPSKLDKLGHATSRLRL